MKIVFIGAGNMAEAVVSGIVAADDPEAATRDLIEIVRLAKIK